jgi:DNA polymerase II large subunit
VDTKKYFDFLNDYTSRAYASANAARKKGMDPSDSVEIPLAKNMAERVEGLIMTVAPQIKNSGLVKRIEELEKKYGKLDWRVAFTISREVAEEKFCKFSDKREAMEVGLRVGLAYLTNGIVASPLEGFTRLELKKRMDGKEYFCLYFSGPIRSAGTTATCAFIALADYIRHSFDYSPYDPTDTEVKRIVTELTDFHERITNLQYMPSEEELAFMAEKLPLQIDGDPSEKIEVSNYKDLPRIGTNVLRNGVCLVFGEGLTQKAKKFWGIFSKWHNEFDMKHWDFIKKFVDLQTKIKAREKKEEKGEGVMKIKPDHTYIKDLVGGRPVLGHPLRTGGFRLRYGRARNSGLSSCSIHPATMAVLRDYIAIGTQIKMERPGKATALSSCDLIEGPIVKLKKGDVLFLDNAEEAKKAAEEIEEIIFLGDILVSYGDFFDRGHVLVPCGYCEEWWMREVEKKGGVVEGNGREVGFSEALELSRKFGISLHPRWTYHWKDINKIQFLSLINWIKTGDFDNENFIIPLTYKAELDIEKEDPKRVLELIGVPHRVAEKEKVIILGDDAKAFAYSIGWGKEDYDLLGDEAIISQTEGMDVLDIINRICDVRIRDKSGTFIGTRMGRPEKAKIRKLTGSPQTLFPVGEEGGKMRSFNFAIAEGGRVAGEFPIFYCDSCKQKLIYPYCDKCNKKTRQMFHCKECEEDYFEKKCPKHKKECISYKSWELNLNEHMAACIEQLGIEGIPDLIKGVKGTSNKNHVPENLAKGILRALYNLYVNKDGTIRYDMTEMSLTGFKPREIGTSVEKLTEIGYDTDVFGNPLVDEEQVVELKPQDVVLPLNTDSNEEGADKVLIRTCKFVDHLLEKFYGMKRFYNVEKREDLIGHLVVGIAPHISAGTIGRIVGFSKTQGFYAHPLFHCAVRRDADGDEVAVMLLMDALLNFSKEYLPAHRGARQDTPLVLTPILVPSEVDDMVFKMDVVDKYPLELYEGAMEYKMPSEVSIKRVSSLLEENGGYFGYNFTHNTRDINEGVLCSSYKIIPNMQEKVYGQIELAEKIRAVDETDVARLIIERHFIRDIKGNLRQFSMQQFRCVKCNEKYRRPPLAGHCLKCGGKIIFTVAKGSIVKYMEPSISLAEKFDLPPYLKQTLELTKMRIESLFGKEKERQEGLVKWFQ